MHRLYKNWQIYASDIHAVGGHIEIVSTIDQDGRSELVDALVTVHNITCPCRMEIFRDGTSVIVGFMQNGKVKGGNLFPLALEFLDMYDELYSHLDAEYLGRRYMRFAAQYVTFALQLASLFMGIFNLVKGISMGEQYFYILSILLFAFFLLAGQLYTIYRKW